MKSFKEFFREDFIKGGLADNWTPQQIADKHGVSIDYINEQLEKGIQVEFEHTNDKRKAREIALDHLYESPDYYIELEKMEDKLES